MLGYCYFHAFCSAHLLAQLGLGNDDKRDGFASREVDEFAGGKVKLESVKTSRTLSGFEVVNVRQILAAGCYAKSWAITGVRRVLLEGIANFLGSKYNEYYRRFLKSFL